MDPIINLACLALLGIASGCYGVIVGAGGGFIIAPLLILVWRVPPHTAVGTTLAAVWLSSLAATCTCLREHGTDWRSGLYMGLSALPSSLLGALGVKVASSSALQGILGALLLLIGLYIFAAPTIGRAFQRQARSTAALAPREVARSRGWIHRTMKLDNGEIYPYSFYLPALLGMNFLLGFISSFAGVGGGFLLTPILVYAFGFPVAVATATSVMAISIYAAAGAITHGFLGNISTTVAAAVGLGAIVGGQLGVRLSRKFNSRWVMCMLALVLVAFGLQLLFRIA